MAKYFCHEMNTTACIYLYKRKRVGFFERERSNLAWRMFSMSHGSMEWGDVRDWDEKMIGQVTDFWFGIFSPFLKKIMKWRLGKERKNEKY